MKLLLIAAFAIIAMALQAQTARLSLTFETGAGTVRITPIYHASMLIEAAGKTIYVDPAKPANLAGLPKADLILITHTHSDHLDPALIGSVHKAGTEILAPPAAKQAVPEAKLISNGESQSWQGWKIEAVPMYNLVRGPEPGKLFHPKGVGNGYVLTYGGKRFYISGDTEVTPEMRALKNIDVAFVSMNLPYTMPPAEAAEGIKAFHPKVVIPYHYRDSDLSVLEKALQGTGIEVRLLDWYPK